MGGEGGVIDGRQIPQFLYFYALLGLFFCLQPPVLGEAVWDTRMCRLLLQERGLRQLLGRGRG